jgi:hypothetical protein
MKNHFLFLPNQTRYVLVAAILFLSFQAHAQKESVDNFIIKENILKNDKLDIIATDVDENPVATVNGTFSFSMNGFTEELKFVDGVATSSREVDKSTFVYLKHKNDNGTHAKLYYVIKRDSGLSPFKINWIVLLLIPVSLIVLGMMFRKFILIAVILLAVLFFFNNSKGLDISTFFETVYHGITSVF